MSFHLCHYASDVRLFLLLLLDPPYPMKHPHPFTHIIEIPCCQAFFSQHLACVLFLSCFRTDTIPISTAFSHTEPARHRKVLVHSLLFLLFFVANSFVREAREMILLASCTSYPTPFRLRCFASSLFLSVLFHFLDFEVPFRMVFHHAPVLIMNSGNVDQ